MKSEVTTHEEPICFLDPSGRCYGPGIAHIWRHRTERLRRQKRWIRRISRRGGALCPIIDEVRILRWIIVGVGKYVFASLLIQSECELRIMDAVKHARSATQHEAFSNRPTEAAARGNVVPAHYPVSDADVAICTPAVVHQDSGGSEARRVVFASVHVPTQANVDGQVFEGMVGIASPQCIRVPPAC